jgi:hypothetical protein
MKRSRIRIRAWVATVLFTMLGPRFAQGDGGIVQLHQTKGPFLVTVFVSPEAAQGGLADVSVLVQWKTNGEVVLDADVSLAVDPPNGLVLHEAEPLCGLSPTAAAFQQPDTRQQQATLPATRAQASNKLLYAAALKLNAAGYWRLHVYVSHGSDQARFDCLLPIARTSTRLTGLWPYFALPPIVIVAFALNQWLRRNSLEKGLGPHLHPHQFTQSQKPSSEDGCFSPRTLTLLRDIMEH